MQRQYSLLCVDLYLLFIYHGYRQKSWSEATHFYLEYLLELGAKLQMLNLY